MVMSWVFGLTILFFVLVKLAEIRMKVRNFLGLKEGSGSPTPHSSVETTLAAMYGSEFVHSKHAVSEGMKKGGSHGHPPKS